MSCNGCRVLRKGCSENCILRPCLQWIESSKAQGYATVFVAKFFGRAGLMSSISAVPLNQRPAVFQSLLYEAAGRTVNPVNGAVGLLSTGNWHVCQAAVETVLQGGALKPLSETDYDLECTNIFKVEDNMGKDMGRVNNDCSRMKVQKRRRLAGDLEHSLTNGFECEKRRLGSPMDSEESGTTTCGDQLPSKPKLLDLFN